MELNSINKNHRDTNRAYKVYTAIGLMSGTSMDGIDLALIKSDGYKILDRSRYSYRPYSSKTKNLIQKIIFEKNLSLLSLKTAEKELTKEHADVVNEFCKEQNINKQEVDIIGFHGQTIMHNPTERLTWQLGNPHLLATQTGINVIADFRTRNVTMGGEGAPLVPIYHKALASSHNLLENTIGILNIGGVANITYIDKSKNIILGFDTGPGNALIDDLIYSRIGKKYDKNGELALTGAVQKLIVENFIKHDYFKRKLPKSLDRNEFNIPQELDNLNIQDALATLCSITAACILENLKNLNLKIPEKIIVCGGGRLNQKILLELQRHLNTKVIITEDIGLNGDFIEAEAFGFLAIRSLLKLPIFIDNSHQNIDTTNQNVSSLSDQHAEQYSLPQQDSSSFYGGVFYHA